MVKIAPLSPKSGAVYFQSSNDLDLFLKDDKYLK